MEQIGFTRDELREHAKSVGIAFPPLSTERTMLEEGLRAAFPEWPSHDAERVAVRLSILLRMSRKYTAAAGKHHWMEFFAGDGKLTKAMEDMGYAAKVVGFVESQILCPCRSGFGIGVSIWSLALELGSRI